MKIAGLKNQSAWFRYNKAIRELPTGDKARLKTIILASDFVDLAHNDILALAAEVGVTSPDFPSSATAWVEAMLSSGIPLQVWMGRLSFTTYAIVEAHGDVEAYWGGNYQNNIRYFAKDLRRMVMLFIKGIRAINDLTNTQTLTSGNPGGLPDGNPES